MARKPVYGPPSPYKSISPFAGIASSIAHVQRMMEASHAAAQAEHARINKPIPNSRRTRKGS